MFEYTISTQWNGFAIDHDPIKIKLTKLENYVVVEVDAPFFDDPKPDGPPRMPFPNLWDFEVVEVFFLGKDDKYLEVELSPHGQHLVLLLNGRRNMVKDKLSLECESNIKWDVMRWTGYAKIPVEYFPPNMDKFNAYGIHGTNDSRIYEALYPAKDGQYLQPDFHRLEYFKSIDMTSLIEVKDVLSQTWKDATSIQ